MCWSRRSYWEHRAWEREEEPITFVSDPEVREPNEPVAEEEEREEREPEKVPAGVTD